MCLPGPGVSNFTLLVQLTGVLVSLWCVDSLGRRPLMVIWPNPSLTPISANTLVEIWALLQLP